MKGLPERYQPKEQIKGGMGAVFFCFDGILERNVAIKFIQQKEFKDRIIHELNALMTVRSKHVVQLYDIIEINGLGLGIVQEQVSGPDLVESFSEPATAHDYYRKLWQIASGIADIHSTGVIHRDIKPNNMKVDRESVIKIFDFGLAKLVENEASTKGFLGTHGFAAPELYSEHATFTNAVDTYAFGATALFLAIGTLPNELINSYGKEIETDYFKNLTPQIAPDVAEILNQCLSFRPEDRPAMSDVRDTISKYLLHERHQALVVYQNSAVVLNSHNRSINLSLEKIGDISITYNGLDFVATLASGEVFLNNKPVTPGTVLPGSCVVALGASTRDNRERAFITFDISNPEVTI